jgi:glycosyltransferase involved in cell wall biosynthesis
MNQPLYSIVIPTYNRAYLIAETLDSVLNQTYSNWECIVVDDGSNDNTANLVKSYIKKDHRFSYLQRPKQKQNGGNAARNYGLKQSKGDFVIFLDSDDLLTVNCLEVRNEILLEAAYDFDMLVSHTATFKTQIGDSDLLWNALILNASYDNIIKRFFNLDMPWHTNGVTWSKTFINAVGTWDETLSSWQDWELHARAMFYKPKILYNFKQVDNYFRKDIKHASIGTQYQSISYLKSIEKAIKSVAKLLSRSDALEQNILKPHLNRLSQKMLIAFPIANKSAYYPLMSLYRLIGFKMINLPRFAWVFIVLFFGRSWKLNTYVFSGSYEEIHRDLELSNTFLKLPESSISNQSDNAL